MAEDALAVTANSKDWLKRWKSTLEMLEEMLHLSSQSTETPFTNVLDRADKLITKNNNRGRAGTPTPEDEILARHQKLEQLAQEMVTFTIQQFAFLLDVLFLKHNFQLGPSLDNTRRNSLRSQRLCDLLAEIGEKPDVRNMGNYALRRVINQISGDVFVLHGIWDQYTPEHNTKALEAIKIGNRLSAHVWQAAKNYLPNTEPPLTYVRPTAGARIIPYGFVPLIGFPPSAISIDQDYLAIPHEFGHFLYWRGEVGGVRLQDKLFASLDWTHPDWLRRWIEEIFADVVGTMLGGPAAALSLQDMMQEKAGNLFVRDDEHYPVAAMRPFVVLAVCQAMEWQNAYEGLRKQWVETVLTTRLGSDWGTCAPIAGLPNLGIICATLETFALKIINLFGSDACNFAQNAWTKDTDYTGTLPSLYTNFGTWMKQPTSFPQLPTTPVQATSWLNVVSVILDGDTKAQLTNVDFSNGSWATALLKALECGDLANHKVADHTINISPEEYLGILYLGGWGDAGPTGGSPHKIG
jgi:hypothetical protein